MARIDLGDGPRTVVAEGDAWAEIEPPFAGEGPAAVRRTGRVFPAEGARLLAPVVPTLVLGMAHNTGEADRALRPQAFQKSPRTVVGPGETIRPEATHLPLVGECELALVVGRTARHVSPEEALDHVFGWTVGNDVTSRAGGERDGLLTESKCGVGFTPLGPWIETEVDLAGLRLEADVDGAPAARSELAGLARTPAEVLSYLSHHLELGPGDVILTGAPFTSAELRDGVTMTCRVPGIGELSNPVRVAPPREATWR